MCEVEKSIEQLEEEVLRLELNSKIAYLGRTNFQKFCHFLYDNFVKIFVSVVFALVAGFSGVITDSITSRYNKQEIKMKNLSSMSIDLSSHVFATRLVVNYYAYNHIDKNQLTELINDYNISIEKIYEYKYINRSLIRDHSQEFDRLMHTIYIIDAQFHELSDTTAVLLARSEDSILDYDSSSTTFFQNKIKLIEPNCKLLGRQTDSLLTKIWE